jgi:PAS domain S-box-containing protein
LTIHLQHERTAPSSLELLAALGGASDALIVADAGGRIQFFNASAERLFGRAAEVVLGSDVAPLLPFSYSAEPFDRLVARLEAAVGNEGRVQFETLLTTDDYRPIAVEVGISLVGEGRSRCYTAVIRDISSRRATETALERSQAVLVAMQRSLPLGVFMCNPAGQCTYVNPRAEQILGLNSADCYGDGWKVAVHPDDYDLLIEGWLRAAERGLSFSSDHRYVHADGRVVWVIVHAAPVHLGEEAIGFVGVIDDVTERRGMRQELCRYTGWLEEANHKQNAQAAELAAARRAADEANQAKSAFLANMSHEIRTPMTAILGYADILAESVGTAEQQEMALTVRRNAGYLLELVNDILDLSKIEAGKLSIEGVPVSPQELIEEVVALMQVRAHAKGLVLRTEARTPLPRTMRADPLRLRQCLVNLVGNAIKFTETGEVCVSLAMEAPKGTGQLRIEVRDSGIGMSPEQLSRLFQPFAQADASTSRRFGGTGLGLTICRRLTELMEGSLSVRSELGKGSAFSLCLPAASLDEAPLYSPRTHGPAALATPNALTARILLAEDGIDNQRLIAHVLRKAGAQVEIVADGAQAVQRALAALNTPGDAPFDLVLMDMQMPVLDGYEATRHLRLAGYQTPIIAITAHAMSDDRAKCLAAGCTEFASKPLRCDELFATIRRCLEGARSASVVEHL